VTYDLAVSPGTVLWQVKMSLVSPAGTSSEGVDLSSTDGDPLSGTIQFLICGSTAPGTYAVRTTGFSQVVPLVNLPIDVADTTFEVRQAPTRTRVASTHLGANRYRVVAIIEHMQECFCSLDSQWRIVAVNRVTEESLGRPREPY